MTTRRLNYTGTRRIRQADVEVMIDKSENGLVFDASYTLSSYALPETAEVVFEAYVEWTLMRFSFGTIGMRHTPETLELSDFDEAEGLRFRLKVLGTGDQTGLILAEADKIRPSDLTQKEAARSFIAVRPADLGAVVWRLTFDQAQPVLHVNDRLGDWKSFLRRPAIRSLLLPEVVRQVLREAVDNEAELEDSDAWQHHALKLASRSSGSPPPGDDDEEMERWIDEVVRKFAQRFRLWRGVSEFLAEEGVE